MTDEVKVADVATLEAQLKAAVTKGDYKAVRQIAKELDDAEKAQAAAERELKLKALADTTLKVKQKIDAVVQKMIDSKELDFADGVWYANDFGSTETSCKLMKSAVKTGTGKSSGKGSYKPCDIPTSELLAKVGDNVMFPEATVVTIDKVEQTIPAGMTFSEALKYSTNGGWRNRVVMAIRKEAGAI